MSKPLIFNSKITPSHFSRKEILDILNQKKIAGIHRHRKIYNNRTINKTGTRWLNSRNVWSVL